MIALNNDNVLTSHQVGELLQVNPSSINKWVNDGLIHAFRTPGGHRRIRVGDLLAFLDKHQMPVPTSLSAAMKQRLLIVDDNTKYVAALKRRLKPYAERLDLEVATNGIDALVQVGAFKPHLLVLDVFMPGEIDGLEVCRRLKASPDTRHIAVLVTTGELTPELEAAARKAGAQRVLAKPIDLGELLEAVGLPQEATT
jgi:excisionase family DNA binding protein